MKICHITIENFRTLENFDTDVGEHNLFVGQNNTGKSNILRAIYCFYNPKDASIDDIRKNSKGEPVCNEFKITLAFDNLSVEEQKHNDMYFDNDMLKVSLIGYLDDNNKINVKHHGYLQAEKLRFPTPFNQELKSLIESESTPKKANIAKFPKLKAIQLRIQPSRLITKENWSKIRIEFLDKSPEITREFIEELSNTNYQGFAGASKHKTTGECILIPAEKDPSIDLSTNRANSPVNQLIDFLISDIESEEISVNFQQFSDLLFEERNSKTKILQDSFNQELDLWKTTVTINQRPIEMSDAIPSNVSILFDDGVITDLEHKGTGLQRYVFFKFLKIANELRLGSSTSLILLFEEPEAHLHPQLQREIASILRQLSENEEIVCQTFVTTHSPQFIDIMNMNHVFVFRKKDGCTEYSKCMISLNDIKEEIKTALFFNPHVNEIFFADRIILVEGQSEEIAINFLVQEGNLDITNVSIISVKSKYNFTTFLKILNAIQISYIVLIDEDPFFLPYYKNTNPAAIKERKKAYKLVEKVATDINSTFGKLVVISPDFDEFMGISKSQLSKHGKPLAVYNHLKKIRDQDQTKYKDIIEFFNKLMKSSFKHNIVNYDDSEWKSQMETDVNIPEANFDNLKSSTEHLIKNYKNVVKGLNKGKQEIIFDLFRLN